MNDQKNTYPISAEMLATLNKEVTLLSSVILSNPILPILENCLLKIEKGHIVLAASDQQTSMISRLPLPGDYPQEALEIAVPAKMFKETLKTLPTQPLSLVVDKQRYNIALEASNGHYKIACENAEDFPDIFSFDAAQAASIAVPAEALLQAIKYTLFAVGKDELRPELTGIHINLSNDGLKFVSSDGHRLVSYKRKDISFEKSISCILPPKVLQILSQQLVGKKDKEVKFSFQDKQVCISFEHIEFIVSLINETYPDYDNVIPKNNPHSLVFHSSYLSTIKRIAIYADKTTHELRCHLEGKELKVLARDVKFSNEAQEVIPCEYNGPAMDIGFNAKLLIEILQVLGTQDEIRMTLDMSNKPVLIMPNTAALQEEDITMLIMPLFLASEENKG